MRYQTFDLFPTQVLRFDFTDHFSELEIQQYIKDIDAICEEGSQIQDDELTPKYQSIPILFQPNAPDYWHKLKDSFLASCQMYIEKVNDFVSNQNNLEFTGARAWFYKGWLSFNKTQSNPWHNHNPSFLSGVFYLRVPSTTSDGGTEFMDPRLNEAHGTRMQLIAPMELTWVIFPGWLYHRSNYAKSETPRYVIAADSYVKVK